MIRLAIVGCGGVVETFHLPALAKVDGIVLSAVVDADEGRARAVAAQSGAAGVQILPDVAEAARVCDAALVTLPNYLHAPVCIQLLQAGRHVLVEKPMATTLEECEQLLAASRQSGAVLGVAMVRRFIVAYGLIRDVIAARTFGDVLRIRVAEGVPYSWPATTGFFLKKEQAGGGVLVDFGSHVLDALMWWLGDLTVTAYADDAYGGVEAECRVECRSKTGVPVSIELSRLRRLSCTARIECERATLEANLHSGAIDVVLTETRGAIRGRVGSRAASEWIPPRDPFALQLRSFAADIERQAVVTETATTAREVARLFGVCAALRRPLEGPASPAVDLELARVG
jgi:predicted dehydrogenase